MPLDPSIILSGTPVQPTNFLKSYLELKSAKEQQEANALAMRQNQLAYQQQQAAYGQQQEQQAYTRDALRTLSENGGDYRKAGAVLTQKGNPLGYDFLQKQTAVEKGQADLAQINSTTGKNNAEADRKRQEMTLAVTQQAANSANGLLSAPPQQQPVLWAQGRANAIKAGVTGAESWPEQWGPDAANIALELRNKGVEVKDQVQQAETNRNHLASEGLQKDQNVEAQRFHTGELQNQASNARSSALQANIAAARERREREKFNATIGAGLTEDGKSLVNDRAMQVADYNLDPPSKRDPMYGAIMIQANKIRKDRGDSPYSITDYQTKVNTAKDFSSGGKSGQQAIALNTLVRHSADLKDAISALGNGNFTPANAGVQKLRAIFGENAPTNFDQLKGYVVGETVKLIRGGGGTEDDVKRAEATLSRASSPSQLAGALDVNFQVAGGKMQSLNEAGRRGNLGKDFNVLDPGAKDIVEQMGYDSQSLKKKGGNDQQKTNAPVSPLLQSKRKQYNY